MIGSSRRGEPSDRHGGASCLAPARNNRCVPFLALLEENHLQALARTAAPRSAALLWEKMFPRCHIWVHIDV
eukprot:10627136-Alexandrium_andersonii.AAC.1